VVSITLTTNTSFISSDGMSLEYKVERQGDAIVPIHASGCSIGQPQEAHGLRPYLLDLGAQVTPGTITHAVVGR